MIHLYFHHGTYEPILNTLNELFGEKITVIEVPEFATLYQIEVDLAEFAASYPGNFMVIRPVGHPWPIVYVTQHHNFGQR